MISYSKKQQLGETEKKSQVEKNIMHNLLLDVVYKKKKLFNICEVKISKDCLKVAKTSDFGTKLNMTYAHKHKRIWYKQKGNEDLLHDFNHTVRCCLQCHMIIEHNKKLTELVFSKLRKDSHDQKADSTNQSEKV